MKYLRYIIFSYFLFVISCVKQPQQPELGMIEGNFRSGVLITCEGIWGMDNASLDIFDSETGILTKSYFERSNPGFHLGDVAQSISIKGDTAYIAVTTSKTIEILSVSSGKSIGRINFNGEKALREIYIVNDSVAFVTDFYDHSIHLFNPSTFVIIKESIKVGPAPEGIISLNGKLFIANSGFGDYLAQEPLAGFITVIDINKLSIVDYIYCGPNVMSFALDKRNNRLYAAYRHLPSKKDSLGGIVEFDVESLKRLREWRLNGGNLNIDFAGNILYAMNEEGVWVINTKNANTNPELLLQNNLQDEFWYSFTIDIDNKLIYIGNARNYQMEGEFLIYSLNASPKLLRKFVVGINPGDIQLFDNTALR